MSPTTARREPELDLGFSPVPTPAAGDVFCWLWAAFPPRRGRLDTTRVAAALEVSPRTVQRWVKTNKANLTHRQISRLHQRAILRGRGHYLWPDLDHDSRLRSAAALDYALEAHRLITEEPGRVAKTWRTNGTIDSHEVHLVFFGHAHVFGVSSNRTDKAKAKVQRFGELLQTVTVPNKYAAVVLKHRALAQVDEHRCIAPRALAPTGRTETWREVGGPVDLTELASDLIPVRPEA